MKKTYTALSSNGPTGVVYLVAFWNFEKRKWKHQQISSKCTRDEAFFLARKIAENKKSLKSKFTVQMVLDGMKQTLSERVDF